MTTYVECPFCHKSDRVEPVRVSTTRGDYQALECRRCMAIAPFDKWQNRVPSSPVEACVE